MNCPLPRYYLCHAVIALLIALFLWPLVSLEAGLAAGTAFYAGREFTQWESGLPFDWKGLLAPFIACLIVLIASMVLA
jgi:hypothetical protein